MRFRIPPLSHDGGVDRRSCLGQGFRRCSAMGMLWFSEFAFCYRWKVEHRREVGAVGPCIGCEFWPVIRDGST